MISVDLAELYLFLLYPHNNREIVTFACKEK
jgi:hypothetical protein